MWDVIGPPAGPRARTVGRRNPAMNSAPPTQKTPQMMWMSRKARTLMLSPLAGTRSRLLLSCACEVSRVLDLADLTLALVVRSHHVGVELPEALGKLDRFGLGL